VNIVADATLKEAIADTKHGMFVNMFHYVNPVEPTKLVFTGLTRDGTFLIEDGEITNSIVNSASQTACSQL